MSKWFFRKLWDLSEWSGIGFHKDGISAPHIFGKAFGFEGKEVDDLGKELRND